jgi:hypothetical protein
MVHLHVNPIEHIMCSALAVKTLLTKLQKISSGEMQVACRGEENHAAVSSNDFNSSAGCDASDAGDCSSGCSCCVSDGSALCR